MRLDNCRRCIRGRAGRNCPYMSVYSARGRCTKFATSNEKPKPQQTVTSYDEWFRLHRRNDPK